MRIHLLEAEDLTAKDTVIKGIIDGKSDPYAVLRVGTQIFTSRHVDSNLNPQWREMFEVRRAEVEENISINELKKNTTNMAFSWYSSAALPPVCMLKVKAWCSCPCFRDVTATT